jgi:chromosome partitioning protein
MAKRISVINFKGGVGKTMLVYQFAGYLFRKDKKVLLVDVDHQSSLSIT